MITLRCHDTEANLLGEIANFTDASGAGLEYVLTCAPGAIGAMVVTVPATVSLDLFPKDGMLMPFRSIAGRAPAHDNGAVYFVRKRELYPSYTKITAYHATSLLQRRIVAFYAGSAETTWRSKPADDLILQLARDQFEPAFGRIGGSTLLVDLVFTYWLAIQADVSLGPAVDFACAWRNLHDACTAVANMARGSPNNAYLTFDIVATGTPRSSAASTAPLEMRVYTTQRGVNRGLTSAAPLVLSIETGSLENALLTEDWSEEVTAVVAGGTGDAALRAVAVDVDFVRLQESPYNRNEAFVDASSEADSAALTSIVTERLNAGRGVTTLRADLLETPGATRGIHYDLGDIVVIRHRGVQYDVHLDTIQVSIGASAAELDAATAIGGRSDAWRGTHPPGTPSPGKRRERMIARV